jgi:hypothetical protein
MVQLKSLERYASSWWPISPSEEPNAFFGVLEGTTSGLACCALVLLSVPRGLKCNEFTSLAYSFCPKQYTSSYIIYAKLQIHPQGKTTGVANLSSEVNFENEVQKHVRDLDLRGTSSSDPRRRHAANDCVHSLEYIERCHRHAQGG